MPGCHASGVIALIKPLIQKGVLKNDAPISCTSVTGYSGGGKKMIADYQSEDKSVVVGFSKAICNQFKTQALARNQRDCRLSTNSTFYADSWQFL